MQLTATFSLHFSCQLLLQERKVVKILLLLLLYSFLSFLPLLVLLLFLFIFCTFNFLTLPSLVIIGYNVWSPVVRKVIFHFYPLLLGSLMKARVKKVICQFLTVNLTFFVLKVTTKLIASFFLFNQITRRKLLRLPRSIEHSINE